MAGRKDELSNIFKGSASRSCGFGEGTKERGTFRFNKATGKCERVEYVATESKSAAVHQDTLKQPLRHMVTGEITESASRLRQLNRETGMTEVGTEKISARPDRRKETITDALVHDRMERAEAIADDPSKFRAFKQNELERQDRARRLLEGR